MLASLLFVLAGFLIGALTAVLADGSSLFRSISQLRRRGKPKPLEQQEAQHSNGDPIVAPEYTKQGMVWVLEAEKVPKIDDHGNPKEELYDHRIKKDIMEVQPIMKYAEVRSHTLLLQDLDGSQSTIELLDCMIVAVSATNLSSHKWAKRYPIKLHNENAVVYNGSKTCYLYVDSSWEKESWCRILRLASCTDKEKLHAYTKLNKEFDYFLATLSNEYPSLFKSSTLFDDVIGETTRVEAPSPRVNHLLKKFAKKTSRDGSRCKLNLALSSINGGRKSSGKLKSLLNKQSGSSENQLRLVSSSSTYLGNKGQLPVLDGIKFVDDEAAFVWNLLFSRLFFDAKRNEEVNNFVKEHIRRTLSNMRVPNDISGITCNAVNLGNLPPYIHNMRVLPMDFSEVWAVEANIEYLGGMILDLEIRIGSDVPELQKGSVEKVLQSSFDGHMALDLSYGLENQGEHKLSGNSTNAMENTDGYKLVSDGLKRSYISSWMSTYASKWKNLTHSISGHVSQVPLSLKIRVASLRGTLCLRIKQPPSDQLWFGFTSMPEIDWKVDSEVTDQKIASEDISLLISKQLKDAIRETLVLPNSECICLPWMTAEKDDWIPREFSPYMWIDQEAVDISATDAPKGQLGDRKKLDSINEDMITAICCLDDKADAYTNACQNNKVEEAGNMLHEEVIRKLDDNSTNSFSTGGFLVDKVEGVPSSCLDDRVEEVENIIDDPSPTEEYLLEPSTSQSPELTSVSSNQWSRGMIDSLELPLSKGNELETPLSRADGNVESYSPSRVDCLKTPPGERLSSEEHTPPPLEVIVKPKRSGRKVNIMDLGKKMGEKIEEKRRHFEEKGRHIVDKLRENTKMSSMPHSRNVQSLNI